jgi:hypothetical protein
MYGVSYLNMGNCALHNRALTSTPGRRKDSDTYWQIYSGFFELQASCSKVGGQRNPQPFSWMSVSSRACSFMASSRQAPEVSPQRNLRHLHTGGLVLNWQRKQCRGRLMK